MKDRDVVKASLSPEAKQSLDLAVEALGMKHQVAFGRLIKWFVEQDRLTQILVMGVVDDVDVPDFTGLILAKHEAVKRGLPLAMTTPQAEMFSRVQLILEGQRALRKRGSKRERPRAASR